MSQENLSSLWEIITKGIKYRIASVKELLHCIAEAMDKEPPHDWRSEREDYLSGKWK